MGYVFIVLTVIMNVVKGFFSKKVSLTTDELTDNINISLIRSALCAICGALFVFEIMFEMPVKGLAICAVSGIFLALTYTFLLIALKTDAYMFASTANNSGFIVAVVCGVLFFGEQLTLFNFFAVVFIIAAIMLMAKYQTELKKKPTFNDIAILLGLLLCAGLSSVSQKWFTREFPNITANLFTYYSFVFSTLFLLLIRFFFKGKKPIKAQMSSLKPILPLIFIMSVVLYAATFFQTKAARLLDAVVLYPLLNGLSLIAGSLMAWIAFKEKPDRYSIIGVILVFIAMVLYRI